MTVPKPKTEIKYPSLLELKDEASKKLQEAVYQGLRAYAGKPDMERLQNARLVYESVCTLLETSTDCPACGGMGSLDEPHLPGGACGVCGGSGQVEGNHV